MRVFIVDDSTAFVDRLAELLEQTAGITVVGTATDEPEALESIRELRPDVAILDLQLRTGSGLRVLESIRKEIPHATVIVLTNFPFSQYRTKCLDAGAQFFLDKSTDFAKVAAICQAISERSQEAESQDKLGWVSRTSHWFVTLGRPFRRGP